MNVVVVFFGSHNHTTLQIEEVLLNKGKEYKEKLERMRAETLKKQEAELTYSPNVLRTSSSVVYDGSRRVEDRLYELAAKKKEKEAQLQAEREKNKAEEVDQEATFKPQITPSARKRHYEGVEQHLYYHWVECFIFVFLSLSLNLF